MTNVNPPESPLPTTQPEIATPESLPSSPELTSDPLQNFEQMTNLQLLSVKENPELLKDMSPEALLKFVEKIRNRALSPATLSASFNTESARIKAAVRGTRPPNAAAAKRKSLLDDL
jgi:hypothetical protein